MIFLYPFKTNDPNGPGPWGGYHGCTTYSGHDTSGPPGGKLDLGADVGTPVYAMLSGKVIYATNSDSNSDYNSILQIQTGDMSIRYIHLENYQVGLNDQVNQGDLIGYVRKHPNGNHLHLDFVVGNNTSPGSGANGFLPPKIQGNYKREDIQNGVTKWTSQGGLKGRCWEVMGMTWKYNDSSALGAAKQGNINVSDKFKNDSDWNALFGMLVYEEGTLMNDFDNAINKAIFEWIIRVFRNRLFSGSSIDSICQWDSGNPGRTGAESRASRCPENIRSFARNIMNGKDYFYVEKIAQQYKYVGETKIPADKWFDRLYSADTFSGGSTARWPFITLAAIPFAAGTFFMEGEFSVPVLNTFWPNGTNGNAKYPSPYQS